MSESDPTTTGLRPPTRSGSRDALLCLLTAFVAVLGLAAVGCPLL